jgi:hypothetical protein
MGFALAREPLKRVLRTTMNMNDQKITMKIIDMLTITKVCADKYRKEAQQSLIRNRHMNNIEDGELVQQRHIDAVLVDFINYIGVKHGVDYALYTSDFENTNKPLKP